MFLFKLEHRDGTAANPPKLQAAVPNWRPGDTIPLGAHRILRVVGPATPARAGATGARAPRRPRRTIRGGRQDVPRPGTPLRTTCGV
jgi:hypothetical protein